MNEPTPRLIGRNQVSCFRLARHHFLNRRPPDLITICADVCGIQAQLSSAAELALWARNHELTHADIQSALRRKKTLVKTSCMRQTLHWLPAGDFSIYIRALRTSRIAALMRIMSKFGIREEEMHDMNQAIVDLLADGPVPQRELIPQLKVKVGKRVRAWMERVWSPFKAALAEGLICYASDQGGEIAFVRVENWLPKPKRVPEDKAKQILLRGYLRAYGPARVHDFSKWAGIPMKEARQVWDSLLPELKELSVENEKAFILARDHKELRNDLNAPILRLLPAFDPYLLAHAEKNHLLEDSHYHRVFRQAGWISPVILLDGKIVGLWSYTRSRNRLTVDIEPFTSFRKPVRVQIEHEAESLAHFLEATCAIRYGH
jgi:hypothetical protein